MKLEKRLDKLSTIDNLYKFNYGAFWLHFLSAVALIVVFSIKTEEANFNTDLFTYKIINLTSGDRDVELEMYKYLDVSTQALEVILILVFLLTSFFHYYYATNGLGSGNYAKEIRKGFNRYRWAEYAITSTLMIFIFAIISGVKDFDTTLSLCALNAVLMSFGYFVELTPDRKSKLIGLGIGFAILAYIWYVIFRNFFQRVEEVKDVGRNLPDWLYGVLIPMFFWWLSFGVVASLKVSNMDKKGYDFKKYELFYIILSYMSKAFMGYYLTYGLLRENPSDD